jgi:hypothetical protein
MLLELLKNQVKYIIQIPDSQDWQELIGGKEKEQEEWRKEKGERITEGM